MASRRAAQLRLYAVALARKRLERLGYPRLMMSLLVGLTGTAGFLASFLLLQAGMLDMTRRYPLAVVIAYAVFLLLLWIWLRSRGGDGLDAGDFSDSSQGSSGASESGLGEGGEFGGAGASGSWDAPTVTVASESPVVDVVDVAGAADEFAIPVALIAIVVLLLFSSLAVIWSAPALFAELLVDGALSATLYRRLRGIETRHWLESAVRRTYGPFVVTALIAAVIGHALALHAPGATTLGTALVGAA